jgi:hypothetical protein
VSGKREGGRANVVREREEGENGKGKRGRGRGAKKRVKKDRP